MEKTHILIEGIGGIGGVVAGLLLRAGLDPLLVTNNPGITEAIRRDGLKVTTPEGSFTAQARVVTTLGELPAGERFGMAFLAMKADAVVEAARATLPLLEPEGGFLVTFQNGMVGDAVVEAAGKERVACTIVGWGATLHAPGVVEKTSLGEMVVGDLDGPSSERVRRLAGVLAPIGPIVVTGNFRGAAWSKLAINCTITTLGALTGETLGEMLTDPAVRRAFLRVYSEVVETAEARGIQLERVATNPRLLYLPRGAGLLKRLVKDLLVRLVGRKYSKLRSSSLQSLERGRRTEIDYLNGYVVRQAELSGVQVPYNAALVRMVKEIEEKKRPIRKANMQELLAALK